MKSPKSAHGPTARGASPGPPGVGVRDSAAAGFLPGPPGGEAAGPLRSWECRVDSSSLEGNPQPRVDVFIAESAKVLSRSQLKARGALILVNGKAAKPSRILRLGDRIEISWQDELPSTLVPEDIALSILYEDDRCLVVDKAQGMVTHPGHGNHRGTLANAVLGLLERNAARRSEPGRDPPEARLSAARPGDYSPRPAPAPRAGIVHRLDKDTSGLIIVAKDAEAQAFLADQFKERTTRKEYLAIVRGLPSPASGRISDRLGRDKRDRKRFASREEGGKPAVTDYRILSSWRAAFDSSRGSKVDGYAFMSLRPRTGRTHQLRVHMAGLGTPILGDPVYGKRDPRFPGATLMLHAYRLKIVLPGKDEPSLFRSPLPERMKRILLELRTAFGGERTPF
ncbi:MAG: RluA family pseudouridine synthase [Rectinemataceae bacterium]